MKPYKVAVWLGPTGVNPDLGQVINGAEKNFMTKELFEKFEQLGLVKEPEPKKEEKKSTSKKVKED